MKELLIVAAILVSGSAFADSQIFDTAKEANFKSCLSTVAELENFFGDGVSYGNWSQWAKENADKQPFTSTIELTFKDGVHLVDLTIAPSSDGTCSYLYTRNWFSSKSCIAASKEPFMKDFEYKTEINQKISGFQKGAVKIFLTPAGDGCLVQKKEVGFRHKKQGA
jgi:hypothetical protein